jgi:AbiV family abortive infection protein
MAKATRPVPESGELIKLALAAKANAREWIGDAEAMLRLKRWPRAYAFSTVALEEYGKAAFCLSFSSLPRELYPASLFWEFLTGHLSKLLMAYQFVIFMQKPSAMAETMQALGRVVYDTNEAKKRGLYADFDEEGRVREPSTIDKVTARSQVRAVRKMLNAPGPMNNASYIQWLAGPQDELKAALAAWSGVFIQSVIQIYQQGGDDGILAFFQDQLQGMEDNRWATPDDHRRELEAAALGGAEPEPGLDLPAPDHPASRS